MSFVLMAGLMLAQQFDEVSQHCLLAAQHLGRAPAVSSDQAASSVRHEFATVRIVFDGQVPTIDEVEPEEEEDDIAVD